MARKSLHQREILLSRRLAVKGPLAPPDDEFRVAYPLLFDLLTRPLVVSERVLEPIRLTLSIGDGDWFLTLSDSVLCQTLTTRALNLTEGLRHLDHLCGSPDARWVCWKGKTVRLPSVPKKVKKKLDTDDGTE